MKKLLYLLVLLLAFKSNLVAQQNHFIYIQSQNKEAFTVNLNNKNYSSTEAGYVIIPKLASGEYNLSVKYPKAAIAENKFDIIIEKKDVGFSLLSAADASLALTNIQSFVTLRAGEKAIYAAASKPTVPENTIAKAETKNIVATRAPEVATPKEVTTRKEVATPKEVTKQPEVKTMESYANVVLRKGVNKLYEMQGEQVYSLLYIDVQDKGNDTIDVVIPAINKERPKVENRSAAIRNNRTTFAPVETKNLESGLSLVSVNQEGYNTNCVNLASGADFFKLRKKMASESNDDKMINELKKAAKNKCFTTVQIKNLASLFMTEEGKYKFFNAAYPLVYDTIQFPTLEKELNEPAYIEKFRAIMHK